MFLGSSLQRNEFLLGAKADRPENSATLEIIGGKVPYFRMLTAAILPSQRKPPTFSPIAHKRTKYIGGTRYILYINDEIVEG